MSITVKNKSRQSFTLNLPPGLDYEEHSQCSSTESNYAVQAVTPDGDVGIREVNKTIQGSITWLAGEVKSKLPVALASIPQFGAARDSGILVVVE